MTVPERVIRNPNPQENRNTNQSAEKKIRKSSGYIHLEGILGTEAVADQLRLLLALFKQKVVVGNGISVMINSTSEFFIDKQPVSAEGKPVCFARTIEYAKRNEKKTPDRLPILRIKIGMHTDGQLFFNLDVTEVDIYSMESKARSQSFRTIKDLFSYVELKLKKGEPILVTDQELRDF